MTGTVTPVKGQRNVWDLRYERGFERDPVTGKRKRKQRSVRFHGTMAQAHTKLRELVDAVEKGTDVQPSKDVLLDWLREWVKVYVVKLRPNTQRQYTMVVEEHVAKSSIALVPLQSLRAEHLEKFMNELTDKGLNARSLAVYSGIIGTALARAAKLRRIHANPAVNVDRPRVVKDQNLKDACWSAIEARRILAYAKEHARPQMFAYIAMALDTGCRRSELNGLAWDHVDFAKGTVRVERQLDSIRPATFGPTKTCSSRVVPINGETLEALRRHRSAQAELKLANRNVYVDLGLVFAKEFIDMTGDAQLGEPIAALGGHSFRQLCDGAGVRRIKFHGTRHTCATLALGAGIPVHIVSKRLGHSNVSMTLDVYATALPDQSADATAIIAEVLWGRREPAAGESR